MIKFVFMDFEVFDVLIVENKESKIVANNWLKKRFILKQPVSDYFSQKTESGLKCLIVKVKGNRNQLFSA